MAEMEIESRRRHLHKYSNTRIIIALYYSCSCGMGKEGIKIYGRVKPSPTASPNLAVEHGECESRHDYYYYCYS